MSLELFAAPAVEPISRADAKSHMRIEHSEDDDFIDSLIIAARQHLDGRDGWLGRQLVTATWDLTLHGFPGTGRGPIAGSIPLPLPPVQSITSITYIDGAGDSQTLSSSVYTLSADLNWNPRVDLVYGQVWPTTRDQPDAVRVRYVAGYGVQADMPHAIRAAMRLLVANWYEHREPVIVGTISASLPLSVDALLAPYQVRSLG